MPPVQKIRLRIEERQALTPCRYLDPAHSSTVAREAPVLRLSALVRVDSSTGTRGTHPKRALIDTGAWISAVETVTWRAYDRAGLIEHLPFAPGTVPPPAILAGRASPFRLGRLWTALLDLQPTGVDWLPAVPVIAQLLLDPACQLTAPFLLGLHLGVLDGRKLRREPVQPSTGPGPPHHTSDCGAWYGQEWFLESA